MICIKNLSFLSNIFLRLYGFSLILCVNMSPKLPTIQITEFFFFHTIEVKDERKNCFILQHREIETIHNLYRLGATKHSISPYLQNNGWIIKEFTFDSSWYFFFIYAFQSHYDFVTCYDPRLMCSFVFVLFIKNVEKYHCRSEIAVHIFC